MAYGDGGQVVDDILLTISGASWPAEPGMPVGTARVGSLSLEREIVASTLPGQIRTKTGFSVGSANVTVPQSSGQPMSPWSPTSDRLVTTGHPAEIVALTGVNGETEPLGAWQVKVPSGRLASGEIAVELAESQYAGRSQDPRFPTVSGPVDPVWIAEKLARQCGFYSTPRAGVGSFFNDALAGVGSTAYSMATGIPGISAAASLVHVQVGSTFPGLTVTANVAGEVIFRVFDRNTPLPVDRAVDIRISGASVAIRWNGGSWSSATYAAGMDPDWPTRVQFRLTATGATTWSVQARSSAAGSWSTAATVTASDPGFGDTALGVNVHSVTGGGVSGVDIAEGTDPGPVVWEKPTARLSLLDGSMTAPWIESEDAWTGLQDVCAAYAGAGWVDRHGMLTVINRHELAGSGRPKTPIDVDRLAEDVSWTLDDDDFADRIEVTWYPVTWPEDADDYEQTLGDGLYVPAGRSVGVEVDLEGYVRDLLPWENISAGTSISSTWEANTASDGSGSDVATGIVVTTDRLSPSRAVVTVTNSNAADVWMVDFSGNPSLIIRGTGAAAQDSPQVITYGADAIDARRPLSVDLSRIVQSKADADSLAAYLWERVNRPRWRAGSVRLPLDWTRDLGDILALSHPGSGLAVNALVTRITIGAGPGSIPQTCDLVVLPPTAADFDAAWAGKTSTDFDAAWLGKTSTAFDNDPLNTEA